MEHVNQALTIVASFAAACVASACAFFALYALTWIVSWLLIVLGTLLASAAAYAVTSSAMRGEDITVLGAINATVGTANKVGASVRDFAARFTKSTVTA